MDNNFLSIEKAVLYGRTIYNNIRKFIVFQLTINVAAVLISFLCPLLQMESPLSITQILWINLIMDTFAALAFGGEPALQKYMKEKPKKRTENIVNKTMWSSIILGSAFSVVVGLILIQNPFGFDCLKGGCAKPRSMSEISSTVFFSFFVFNAIFNAFNARTDEINLFSDIKENKNFLKIMGSIAIVQILLCYFGGDIFQCYGLSVQQWITVLLMSFLIIPVDLLRKNILKKYKNWLKN